MQYPQLLLRLLMAVTVGCGLMAATDGCVSVRPRNTAPAEPLAQLGQSTQPRLRAQG